MVYDVRPPSGMSSLLTHKDRQKKPKRKTKSRARDHQQQQEHIEAQEFAIPAYES